ncbi:MAG: hypothetical protein WB973_00660 [Thermoanaerobaculia bacterium]
MQKDEQHRAMGVRRLSLDVVFSLATVALTVLFDFVQEALSNPAQLKAQWDADPEKVLAVQFDLLLVALTILFGAYVSTGENERGKLVPPLFLSFFVVLGMLALAAASKMLGLDENPWLTVRVPDLLGLISIAVAVSAARSVP